VLALAKVVTATMMLVRNLFPIVKAFFLIAYSFFFVFSLFAMSMFSYAASSHGIAYYPTKSQYIDYFTNRAASEYPNQNNPGNFGCNGTDALGTQGLCGQAGPQSPLPHWSTTDSSVAAVAALDAAFIVGSGFDARVGGCFNLIGAADDRVLPCYCYYNAERMNRTTSCDWLNAAWYKTEIGQVFRVLVASRLR
jgi:hypothetical protein